MATLEKPVAATAIPLPFSFGWLRSPSFDSLFIGGVAAIALASTALVVRDPSLFTMILVMDMWLLGFHHVVATFTRLTFDTESFQTHRFLVVWLPMIVLAGVFGLVLAFGGWILPTLYLYWQWFHYTRQSYGIAQIYRRKAGALGTEPPLLTKSAIYLLPLWGILYRSWQEPSRFLSMEVKTLPVPLPVVQAAGVLTAAALAWWLGRQIVALFQRRLPVAYVLYMLSHVAIFAFGYLIVDDLDHGWLTINIWHNAQYILLVWMYNNNRFKNGVDPKHRFLSAISQPDMAAAYFLICVGLSSLFYFGIDKLVGLLGLSLLPVTLIAYQTINFHHYIVDGIIWKVRKPVVREHLGVT